MLQTSGSVARHRKTLCMRNDPTLPVPIRTIVVQHNRADGFPASVCCTPEEAAELADLVRDDPHLHEGALRHLAEVEDVWAE